MTQNTGMRVREVLGTDRVTGVDWHIKTDFDGFEILRLAVVYNHGRALTVDEMTRVIDALIEDMPNADAPFPVIDFVADTDHAPIAAE